MSGHIPWSGATAPTATRPWTTICVRLTSARSSTLAAPREPDHQEAYRNDAYSDLQPMTTYAKSYRPKKFDSVSRRA